MRTLREQCAKLPRKCAKLRTSARPSLTRAVGCREICECKAVLRIYPISGPPRVGFYLALVSETIGGTICKPGWTKALRPPYRVTDQIKRDKLRAAGWTDADKNRFELDYIIPLSLGGAPADPKNFQLEPGTEVVEKEALEACLPRLVCERRLMLDEARKAVWRDWRAALSLCRD
jgi:hypothetical protein